MTDAITGTFVRVKTLADGTPQVVFNLDCKLTEFAAMFATPGDVAAIVRLTDQAARQTLPKPASPYGKQAERLRQSGFCSRRAVWEALGTDEDYLKWLRGLPCAVCYMGPAEAAHVRRVADGAGTGIKPTFSAIPLCREHHAAQHQHGESAIGGKEWVDKKRMEYVEDWAWATLKAKFGHDSMKNVPPHLVREWAAAHDLDHHLPDDYKNAACP